MIRTKSYFIANRATALTVDYPVISNNVITIDASLSNYFEYTANGTNTTPKTIEVVGSSSKGSGNVTTDTLNLHANTRPGDVVLVWVYSSATGSTINVTSSGILDGSYYGWKIVSSSTSAGGMSLVAENKKMFNNSPLSLTYSGMNATSATVAATVTLRNVKTTHLATNILADATSSASGTTTVPNPAARTPTDSGSMSVVAVGIDAVNVAGTLGVPSGYTSILNANATITGCTIGLSFKQLSSLSPEDPAQIGSTSYTWHSLTTIASPINPSTYLNIINVPSKEYKMIHRISAPSEVYLENLISMQNSNFLISQRVSEWGYTTVNPDSQWYVEFQTKDWGNTWVINGFYEAY